MKRKFLNADISNDTVLQKAWAKYFLKSRIKTESECLRLLVGKVLGLVK